MFVLLLTTLIAGTPPTTPTLSPELRALLIEEMKLLEESVNKIPGLLARGALYPVAVQAHQMQDSFVLKKKLTPEQRTALHRQLPAEFIKRDQRFHALAGKLHDAALAGDAELSAMFFGRLVEACIGCHGDYAAHRFPKLKTQPKAAHHH
ncbi:hypothetical protein APED_28585 [Acanthopleuribacter pedis]